MAHSEPLFISFAFFLTVFTNKNFADNWIVHYYSVRSNCHTNCSTASEVCLLNIFEHVFDSSHVFLSRKLRIKFSKGKQRLILIFSSKTKQQQILVAFFLFLRGTVRWGYKSTTCCQILLPVVKAKKKKTFLDNFKTRESILLRQHWLERSSFLVSPFW